MLAKLEACLALANKASRKRKVTLGHFDASVPRWRLGISSGKNGKGLGKDEGIAHRTASDHHARNARLVEHTSGLEAGGGVTRTKYR